MSNYRDLVNMPSGVHDVLWQMFCGGPIRDGNLVCKTSRNWLKDQGLVDQSSGFNFLTASGVDLAVSLGMDGRKEREGAHN